MKKNLRVGCAALVILFLLLGGGAFYKYGMSHGMNFDFDPAYVAASETKMWKAYYTKDRTTLGIEIVKLLNEQFGLSVQKAAELGEGLARTVITFATSRDNYQQNTLPGLVDYYTKVHDLAGGAWKPEEVAQAELDWWVARRTPGYDSPENVGYLIGVLYSKLYGQTNEHISRAGLLRAQAAAVRDAGGLNADWERIESMLLESYTELRKGIVPDRAAV